MTSSRGWRPAIERESIVPCYGHGEPDDFMLQVNRSKGIKRHPILYLCNCICPYWDSNPDAQFRKLVIYPVELQGRTEDAGLEPTEPL